MKKLGLVIGEGGDQFIKDLVPELQKRFEVRDTRHYKMMTPLIKDRDKLFEYKLKKLGDWADILFFEWADWHLAIASKLEKKAKIVTRLHSYELVDYAEDVNWDNVDVVILISEAMKERLIELSGIDESRTVVIKNMVDTSIFAPKEEHGLTHNLGTLAHIRSVKRFYDLVLAFSEIQKEMPDLKLIIGGPVDEKEKRYFLAIKELIGRLGLEEKVILEGKIRDPENWFHKIDVYINHSLWEGFSVSLLEAMASGCYPLVHSWRGANEMVPPENIYTFDIELKSKVLDFYSWDEARRREELVKVRKIIQREFVDQAQAGKILDVLDAL